MPVTWAMESVYVKGSKQPKKAEIENFWNLVRQNLYETMNRNTPASKFS